MKKAVSEYLCSKNNLMQYFNCKDDYFIKPIVNYYWRIKEEDDVYFLSYWKDGSPLNECVIVKKNNKPLIFEKRDYTMIIGVECVKVGLVVRNINKT